MSPFSPSIGLAAPHPLTERRRKRVGRNTSETGECAHTACECHHKKGTLQGFVNSCPHSDGGEGKTGREGKGRRKDGKEERKEREGKKERKKDMIQGGERQEEKGREEGEGKQERAKDRKKREGKEERPDP